MRSPAFRFGVWGGFRVQGSGFRVQGSRFRVQGSGFRVQVSGWRVYAYLPIFRFPGHGVAALEKDVVEFVFDVRVQRAPRSRTGSHSSLTLEEPTPFTIHPELEEDVVEFVFDVRVQRAAFWVNGEWYRLLQSY